MPKVVLITGAARRVGAEIAATLHAAGLNVIIHYNHSESEAQKLFQALNAERPNSAHLLKADLSDMTACNELIQNAYHIWGQLDVLINNASRFYKTPLGNATLSEWDDLINSNLKSVFFLSQAAKNVLTKQQGCIINMADIHAEKPMRNYSIYCIAKAGLVMLTKSLAQELGPDIRVNAIAPGFVLPPEGENQLTEEEQKKILKRIALKRPGSPTDVAKTVLFLVNDSPYITGQILAVDGGRSLAM